MYQRKTTIINRTGIHARPASVFVNEAKKFQSNITICNLSLKEQNNTANAKFHLQGADTGPVTGLGGGSEC